MTDEGDGTYSYKVPKMYDGSQGGMVVFNDGGQNARNQLPKSNGFKIKDGQLYDEDYKD